MTMATVRKFHVVLEDGSERDVTGKDAKVRDGALVISGGNSEEAVIYAAGKWVMCELERKDDKG
jgi:hypothetical protein